jgi:hypothetical protein
MSRVLAIFGIKLKKDLQAMILKKEKEKAAKYGRTANTNSRLAGTITLKFDNTDSPTRLQIFIEDYWFWVNGGRKPGSVAKAADIHGWIRRKNISPVEIIKKMDREAGVVRKKPITFAKALDQFDFLVRRKLKAKGFKGNDFFDEVVYDGRLEQLAKDLANEGLQFIINGDNNTS